MDEPLLKSGLHDKKGLKESGNEMYKLTYDSDDNDEINAPSTPQGQSASGFDTKMKIDSTDANEKSNGNLPSPNQRKTKDMATYEGNGRLYSLFSNDNFLTEDPKRRRKSCCCIGVKTALFIVTVVVLAAALLGLMWVVRGMQIENRDMERRIAKLENDPSNGGTSLSSSDSESAFQSMMQRPQSIVDNPQDSAGAKQTSGSVEKRIDYLTGVLEGHAKRFSDLESKLNRHTSEDYTHKAEVTRIMAENSVDVETALSQIQAVRNLLHKAEATADTAKHLALFAMKDIDMTEEELTQYLQTVQTNDAGEKVAFSVAHAKGSNNVVSYDYQEGTNSGSLPTVYYDVKHDVAPVISFTEEMVDTGEYITQNDGTYHAPLPGNYVIFVSFCVQSNTDTSVHLIRNGKLVRDMKVSSDRASIRQNNDESLFPLGLLLPLPSVNPGDPPVLNQGQYDPSLGLPPLPGANGPQVDDFEPPLFPSPSADTKYIRPYQFTEVISLEEGDTLSLRIAAGSIVEYMHQPGTDATQESCTRFSGYKL